MDAGFYWGPIYTALAWSATSLLERQGFWLSVLLRGNITVMDPISKVATFCVFVATRLEMLPQIFVVELA